MRLVAVAEVVVVVRVNAASMDVDEVAAPRPMTVQNERRQPGRKDHLLLGDWAARHQSGIAHSAFGLDAGLLRSTKGAP